MELPAGTGVAVDHVGRSSEVARVMKFEPAQRPPSTARCFEDERDKRSGHRPRAGRVVWCNSDSKGVVGVLTSAEIAVLHACHESESVVM